VAFVRGSPQVQTCSGVKNGPETTGITSYSEDDKAMDELADLGMDVRSDTVVADPGSVYSGDDSESFDEDALSSGTSLASSIMTLPT
jgi:hypothetical protein